MAKTKTRECGSCTMCCKVLGIRELEKMPNVMCKHVVKGKGCGIYDVRPPTCRSFSCTWLLTDTMPEELKPNKCHAVFAMYEQQPDQVTIYVDPGYPHAFREGALAHAIELFLAKKILVLVAVGDRIYHRLGKKWVEARVVRDLDNPFNGKVDVFNVGDVEG